MKKILRLLIAAGIFQALIIILAAVYWLVQPAVEDLPYSFAAIWEAWVDHPSEDSQLIHSAVAVAQHNPEPTHEQDIAHQIGTSVAATLAHISAEQFGSEIPSPTPATLGQSELPEVATPTIQATATAIPSASLTSTAGSSPSATNTTLASASATRRSSSTPTATASPAPSPSGTATRTSSPAPSGTLFLSPTASLTSTPTNTKLPSSSTPTASGPAPTPTVDLSGCSYNNDSSFEDQVLALLNQEREAVGLPPLVMQSQLRSAAREHSTDMACNNFVSHTGSNGTTSYIRITSYGYYPTWWGENIYKGWRTSPEQAVAWWMNSEPHRNNILHSYYVHIGVGYIRVGDSAAYTLNFGRR